MADMEEEEEFENLAAALAGARKRAGLTQRQAGEAIGMSGRAWQEWEAGNGDPVRHIPNIETALGLRRGWFSGQLTVLERLLVFEERQARIEEKLDESVELLRDAIGLLRITR
jgi:transcriptional regulator with XRE-family HTH domain